ncbi:MAG TPA: hypothetical protein VFV38_23750 [Ktedonobacteraceae bacterium]|nr:hypothetical protein [Ktedonobacteraceae bacterium]
MLLPIAMIAVSLFFLAFLGLNKLLPTIFGLAAALGLLFGLYFVWLGVMANNGESFIWGSVLLLGGGAVLVYLKTAFSD